MDYNDMARVFSQVCHDLQQLYDNAKLLNIMTERFPTVEHSIKTWDTLLPKARKALDGIREFWDDVGRDATERLTGLLNTDDAIAFREEVAAYDKQTLRDAKHRY